MNSPRFEAVFQENCSGCYGISCITVDGAPRIAVVSECRDTGVIHLVHPEDHSVLEASRSPGGGMNLVPLATDGEFLCIQRFFPVFQSEQANVVWGYRVNGQYHCKEVVQLPFVHRIEVIRYGGRDHLLCASLCSSKDYPEDWSHPGGIYVGAIDYQTRTVEPLQEVVSGLIQNHGMTKLGPWGEDGVLISAQNGVHLLTPPGQSGGRWSVRTLIDQPISDCVAVDLDGDGDLELGTISPFHGPTFQIWKAQGTRYHPIYTLPGTHAFGHAIWAGTFHSTPSFLVGYRGGEMGLYLIQYRPTGIVATQVDAHSGPANVTVLPHPKGDLICAANRQTDCYTFYRAL